MDLLEHQGKRLLGRYGIPTPAGVVGTTPDEVERAARQLDGPVVVKAQVKTGGRGKAGGIRRADDPAGARTAADAILGMDIAGHRVGCVFVERAADITDEYYLSVMHDRVGKGYVVICSAEGGVDIEQVSRERPEAVVTHPLIPSQVRDGLDRSVGGRIVRDADIPQRSHPAVVDLMVGLFDAFVAADALLCEINPLVVTGGGDVLAVDAKVTLDDNAFFRHPEYDEFAAEEAVGDRLEAQATRKGLAYVKLDGNIGVLGNGAGLVMATIDVVAEAGGRPADFLDVGGGASADVMADSLAIVLGDPQVTTVLVNIYGGITRCEEIARGILDALDRLGEVRQKLVVRLDGTNAQEGRGLLQQAAHPNIVAAATMQEAAVQAVALAETAADRATP